MSTDKDYRQKYDDYEDDDDDSTTTTICTTIQKQQAQADNESGSRTHHHRCVVVTAVALTDGSLLDDANSKRRGARGLEMPTGARSDGGVEQRAFFSEALSGVVALRSGRGDDAHLAESELECKATTVALMAGRSMAVLLERIGNEDGAEQVSEHEPSSIAPEQQLAALGYDDDGGAVVGAETVSDIGNSWPRLLQLAVMRMLASSPQVLAVAVVAVGDKDDERWARRPVRGGGGGTALVGGIGATAGYAVRYGTSGWWW